MPMTEEEKKEARRESSRKFRENNKEKIKESRRQYREANKEKLKEIRKKHYEKNKEEMIEYSRQYREENKDKVKESLLRYREENKDKMKESQRKYRETNKEKIKEIQKRSYEKNKEKIIKKQQERIKNNKKLSLDKRMSSSIRNHLSEYGLNKNKRTWEDLVGYTIEDLVKHLEKQFDENMTWENRGTYWHIDHIKPKSLFLFETIEDPAFRECWALSNLRPLEAKENILKGNKYEEPT